MYTKVKLEDCLEIVEKTIVQGETGGQALVYKARRPVPPRQADIPFYEKQTRLVLSHCGQIDATSHKEYLGMGGYTAFEKALFDLPEG